MDKGRREIGMRLYGSGTALWEDIAFKQEISYGKA